MPEGAPGLQDTLVRLIQGFDQRDVPKYEKNPHHTARGGRKTVNPKSEVMRNCSHDPQQSFAESP
jgi:hypothetical protein